MSQLFDTLCEALKSLGSDVSQFQFDTHSTVVMQFADVGEIILDPSEEQVALWARLETSSQARFNHRAEELLSLLSEPAEQFGSGCMVLRQLEDGSAVGGVLHPACQIDSSRMASAIQDFHARVITLQAVLQ